MSTDRGTVGNVVLPHGRALGRRATLVQFSSAFCMPCRATRALLTRVAKEREGVRHVELEVTDHPRLAEDLGVTRTPTVIVLDAAGRMRTVLPGVPRLAEVRSRLGGL